MASIAAGRRCAARSTRRRARRGQRPQEHQSSSIRVIDGDTIETWLDGQQTGIGLIGINAARANDQCGKAAVGKMYSLGQAGAAPRRGYEASPSTSAADACTRRIRKDGALLGRRDGQGGLCQAWRAARPRSPRASQGSETRQAAARRPSDAAAANRGCATNFEPSTRDALNRREDTRRRQRRDGPSPAASPCPCSSPDDAGSGRRARCDPRGLLLPVSVDAATSMPQGFTQDVVARDRHGDQGQPTAFAFLPDGRILITMKNGMVRLVKNGALVDRPVHRPARPRERLLGSRPARHRGRPELRDQRLRVLHLHL